jgi:hypothetical protein
MKKIQHSIQGRGYKSYNGSLKWTKQGSADQTFSTPELTLTESSDDSAWHDFSPGIDSNSTFQIEGEVPFSNETKYQRLCLYPMPKKTESKTISLKTSPVLSADQRTTSRYSKYSLMIIRGHTVAEVSQVMAEDNIEPSVISLVMLAATETHSSNL